MSASLSLSLLHVAKTAIPGGCLGALYLPENLRMVMARGAGSRLWDLAGREYVDFLLGSGPILLGHAHPGVVEAIRRQAECGLSYFALNEPAIRLAERLIHAIPCAEAVRFQTTGGEATSSAIRIARAATGRAKILKFEGGWHGTHDLAQMSVSPQRPLPFPTPSPDCDGISPAMAEEVLVAPFNDAETAAAIVDAHAQEIAAVIVEPVQRALAPAPGFLEALRSLTSAHGIVLIFDEVVTGFRLAWGGAQERYGVIPDLACYGKAVASGMPLSVVAGRRDLIELADPSRKGLQTFCMLSGTLTANPLACAAALAGLDALAEPGVFPRLQQLGEELARRLRSAAHRSGVAAQVVGVGPIQQLYFVDERPLATHRDTMAADAQAAVRFGRELIRRGVYCHPGSKLYVSLAHADADFELLEHAAAGAFEAMNDAAR